jgi:hypothetical protein
VCNSHKDVKTEAGSNEFNKEATAKADEAIK